MMDKQKRKLIGKRAGKHEAKKKWEGGQENNEIKQHRLKGSTYFIPHFIPPKDLRGLENYTQ